MRLFEIRYQVSKSITLYIGGDTDTNLRLIPNDTENDTKSDTMDKAVILNHPEYEKRDN
jgi:hypothetical protein